jgi:transposase-like protein
MKCPYCHSSTTTERPEATARGYRRFRCRACARGFNERTGSVFNRVQYPPDVVCLVLLWRSLRSCVVPGHFSSILSHSR